MVSPCATWRPRATLLPSTLHCRDSRQVGNELCTLKSSLKQWPGSLQRTPPFTHLGGAVLHAAAHSRLQGGGVGHSNHLAPGHPPAKSGESSRQMLQWATTTHCARLSRMEMASAAGRSCADTKADMEGATMERATANGRSNQRWYHRHEAIIAPPPCHRPARVPHPYMLATDSSRSSAVALRAPVCRMTTPSTSAERGRATLVLVAAAAALAVIGGLPAPMV